MSTFYLACCAAILFLSTITLAQVVQDDWVFPSLPDESTIMNTGDEYMIRWTTNLTDWFPQYAPSADVTNVDLWITGNHDVPFRHLVSGRSHIEVSAPQKVSH